MNRPFPHLNNTAMCLRVGIHEAADQYDDWGAFCSSAGHGVAFWYRIRLLLAIMLMNGITNTLLHD